jgi:L-lactate permease
MYNVYSTRMNEEELIEKINNVKKRAEEVSKHEVPDAMEVDRLDAEMTALMATVGTLYVRYDSKARMWKEYKSSLQEMARSMRRIHETLNTEKRFTH